MAGEYKLDTALDAIDALSDEMVELVKRVNEGRDLTPGQFAAAHARAMEAALPKFLNSLREGMGEQEYRKLEQSLMQQLEQAKKEGKA